MMITFQFQIQDTAHRMIHSVDLLDSGQEAMDELGKIISMAGIGVDPDSVVVTATDSTFAFRTRWNYGTGLLMVTSNVLQISLGDSTAVGRPIVITQGGATFNTLARILWIEELAFEFYRLDDSMVSFPTTATSRGDIRFLDMMMTLRKPPPRLGAQPLRTRIASRLYLMNSYLQGG